MCIPLGVPLEHMIHTPFAGKTAGVWILAINLIIGGFDTRKPKIRMVLSKMRENRHISFTLMPLRL